MDSSPPWSGAAIWRSPSGARRSHGSARLMISSGDPSGSAGFAGRPVGAFVLSLGAALIAGIVVAGIVWAVFWIAAA